ncbi:Mpv17/PMP22 family protein [Mycoplasmatota bacterium]|nr:Mpv17/PMP22 family protein [Mycoplasmatota bacterium]
MKRKDSLFVIIFILICTILVVKQSRNTFIDLTNQYPYLMGFIKVAVLATMGELLASRISKGTYKINGIILKMIIWGLIGCSFVLVFKLFASGVIALQEDYLLPQISHHTFLGKLLFAFLTSTLMNLIFAPTFMAFHRITDTYIELGHGNLKQIASIKSEQVIKSIDWNHFIKFVVFKTIPFFWIPAHTVTFLLPEVYRVLVAALLSIVLGIILSLSKRQIKRL